MQTADQAQRLLEKLKQDGTAAPEIVRQMAESCLGWPYVFGAWGEACTPSGRKRRARADHPTIVSKCQVLSGKKPDCAGCKWGEGVRMFDCRGFTYWLLMQAGIEIKGQGATSQYNTPGNWTRRGPIREMPDAVCCVFKQDAGGKMQHTGMHVGSGRIIHCSSGVQTGKTADRGWTHYAIPAGLYEDIPEEKPMPETEKRTLRQGSRGEDVLALQMQLNSLGWRCGTEDGIYGAKTKAAVMAFQTWAHLQADGICGPMTWAALDAQASPEPEAGTYRVTVEGATWAQYRKILEICPLAEAEREAGADD